MEDGFTVYLKEEYSRRMMLECREVEATHGCLLCETYNDEKYIIPLNSIYYVKTIRFDERENKP